MPGLVDSPMASEADNYSWPQKSLKVQRKEEIRRELERLQQQRVVLEAKERAVEMQESAGLKRKRLDELTDVVGAPVPRKIPKLKIKQQGQLVRSADFGRVGEKRTVGKGGLPLATQSFHTGPPQPPNPVYLERPPAVVREFAEPSGRGHLPTTMPLQPQHSLKSPKSRTLLFEPASIPGTWELLEQCKQVMQHLSKNKNAGAFRQPVDVVGLGLPNYYDKVKEPMDLSLVRDRLTRGFYTTPAQFARDVRLIWSNCKLFNPPDSSFAQMADKMSQSFESKFAPIERQMRDLGLTSVDEEDERVAQEKAIMEAERRAKM